MTERGDQGKAVTETKLLPIALAAAVVWSRAIASELLAISGRITMGSGRQLKSRVPRAGTRPFIRLLTVETLPVQFLQCNLHRIFRKSPDTQAGRSGLPKVVRIEAQLSNQRRSHHRRRPIRTPLGQVSFGRPSRLRVAPRCRGPRPRLYHSRRR
jgi:hypothetical protein